MAGESSTCWTMIEGAARGESAERDRFVRSYAPVVDAYLRARWKYSPLRRDADDARQEVMLECLKEGGALGRADRGGRSGFRGFLHGVARNVTARFEERAQKKNLAALRTSLDERRPELQEEELDRVFDRAWAEAVMAQAADLLRGEAERGTPAARRRFEILTMRFQDGLPVRDIAGKLGLEPPRVQKDYATAREEFRAALVRVVAWHLPGPPDDVEAECRSLLALLKRSD